ncbi:MAG: carboxy-S-adenosyl-L-methionine synthase CmoA [Methylococcaceae bacterium]
MARKPTKLNDPSDRLFSHSNEPISDFHFNEKTASVFDDMVNRSVPFYAEIQRMTVELASDFAAKETQLFDLGCATGTTLLHLDRVLDPSIRFIGVDNAKSMLDKANQKLIACPSERSYDLVLSDLHQPLPIENASVVIMVLTLQFVRPLYRQQLIKSIYDGLNSQGALIIFEKITVPDSLLNRIFISHYYEMKSRQGYSDIEIANKREALENVLIPYHPEENIELLQSCGFNLVEEFFRWYNFCGVLAVK